MANEVAAQGKVICDSHPDSEKICFRREGGRLIYQYDAEKLWIEPWGKNSLRVRATHMAEMPWEDWALTEPAGSYDPEIQIHEDGSAEIRHGKLVARFTAGRKALVLESKRAASVKRICPKPQGHHVGFLLCAGN